MADLYPPWHERAIRHALANVRSGGGGDAGSDGRHHPLADPAVLSGPDGHGATDPNADPFPYSDGGDSDKSPDISLHEREAVLPE
jgi:hypothetical protein